MSFLGHIIQDFYNVFVLSDSVRQKNLEYRQEAIARKICTKYARGNISLQEGRYVTTRQMNERREKILNYDFHSSK